MPLEQDGFHTLPSASIYSGNLELLYILGRCWPWLLGNERVLERHQENNGNINSTNTQSNDASANTNNSTTSNTTADSSSNSRSRLLVILVDIVIHTYVQIHYAE